MRRTSKHRTFSTALSLRAADVTVGRESGHVTPFRVTDWPMYYCFQIERQHMLNATMLLHQHGLHHREWRVLANLDEHDGSMIGHIAQRAGIERSTMSKMMDALAARGLVVVARETADRRRSLVHLTKAGREKLADTLPIVEGLFQEYFKDYPEGQFEALMRLLRDLLQRVGRPDLRAATRAGSAAQRKKRLTEGEATKHT